MGDHADDALDREIDEWGEDEYVSEEMASQLLDVIDTHLGKTRMTTTFGKPKAKDSDGNFKFKLPENMGAGRGRIKAGPRVGRCVDVIEENAKSSGNPMWTWTFVITAGPDAGRDFKLWTVLTDDAAWKIAETFKALGLEAEPGEEITLSKKDVIGVGCTMHIKDDNGRDGDGEFSKLDKISAHPKGAGYKAKGGIAAQAAAPVQEEDEQQEEGEGEGFPCDECDFVAETEEDLQAHIGEDHPDEEEAPPPPPRRTAAPKPVAKKGKAPVTLGRGRK